MIGRSLGRYRIVRRLGRGGMGEVWAAEDSLLKRVVALKLLPPELAADPARRARFEREAEAVAALDHPNIVTLHSLEEVDGVQFLTMQLVEGSTLDAVLRRRELAADEILRLALQVVDAVRAAHRKGVVHRDLKPANVMVGADGRVRVLDFGVAKLRPSPPGGSSQTEVATVAAADDDRALIGTLPYMAPEQLTTGKVDERTDIFALGVTFYEMAARHRPFDAPAQTELVAAILRDQPPPLTDVRADLPADFVAAVERCLRKDPDRRYQEAADLQADLQAAAGTPTAGTAAARSPGAFQAAWPVPEKPSLAVLPFVNVSGDPEQEYFADGLTVDLHTELVKLTGLFLISQGSTFTYKGRAVSPEQVARELGVRHVLQGTVRKAGNRVRVTAQLVDAASGDTVWSKRYDREVADMFELQDDLTDHIVTAMEVELVTGEGARLLRNAIRDPEARDLFYRGMEALFKDTAEDRARARRLFSEAVQMSPDSPWGYIYLALTEYFDVAAAAVAASDEALDRAHGFARQALERGDVTGMANMILGHVSLMRGEHDRALEHADVALHERPSCPWAYVLKAGIFNYTGKSGEALDLARASIRLSPLVNSWMPAVLSTSLYLTGQPQEAADMARHAISLTPHSLGAHVMKAAASAAAGDDPQAASAAEEVRRLKPDFSLNSFAEVEPYRDPADLEAILADLRKAGLA